MKSLNLYIELEGTWCNEWPDFKLVVNNSTYIDEKIQGKKSFRIVVPIERSNQLVLEHYNKRFGENNIWDTKAENNTIVEDRAIKLLKLEFDDVDLVKHIHMLEFITTTGQLIHTDYFGHNGKLLVNFTAPVYNWIIETFISPPQSVPSDILVVETSHSNLFNYESDLIELNNIEQLLKEHAHLFNKPTSL